MQLHGKVSFEIGRVPSYAGSFHELLRRATSRFSCASASLTSITRRPDHWLSTRSCSRHLRATSAILALWHRPKRLVQRPATKLGCAAAYQFVQAELAPLHQQHGMKSRSEARRVGKEGVRRCSTRGTRNH